MSESLDLERLKALHASLSPDCCKPFSIMRREDVNKMREVFFMLPGVIAELEQSRKDDATLTSGLKEKS